MIDAQQTPPAPAVRLIFEYEGDAVRLVSQQPVDTVVTDFAPGGEAGSVRYVVETRDDHGQRLGRVPARGAFLESVEVFPEDHTEPIVRVDVHPRGAFTVVVPAPAEAAEVAVVRVAPSGREALQDVDLGTFPLER
ncbi:hypothetical protein PV721_28045 [Streptomyces sp. MB09-01]|uniref:hypothetical protein n=1 Tax=Streptomyces sp. MB09-01 TaxID=3028666 RepID=UPI0029A2C8C0|nr:hypothetical protein [Streptomyces sp. MB09-01]MDX3538133.1 hypothetical protein [Streptomyces sp. MB09-01]